MFPNCVHYKVWWLLHTVQYVFNGKRFYSTAGGKFKLEMRNKNFFSIHQIHDTFSAQQ